MQKPEHWGHVLGSRSSSAFPVGRRQAKLRDERRDGADLKQGRITKQQLEGIKEGKEKLLWLTDEDREQVSRVYVYEKDCNWSSIWANVI